MALHPVKEGKGFLDMAEPYIIAILITRQMSIGVPEIEYIITEYRLPMHCNDTVEVSSTSFQQFFYYFSQSITLFCYWKRPTLASYSSLEEQLPINTVIDAF